MPLLEEVGEGSEEANCGAEDLKAEHRRKRAKKTNSKSRKKKVEVRDYRRLLLWGRPY